MNADLHEKAVTYDLRPLLNEIKTRKDIIDYKKTGVNNSIKLIVALIGYSKDNILHALGRF